MRYIFALLLLTVTLLTENKKIFLKGKLFVKGSSPHHYTVIEEIETFKNYKINNPKAFHLSKRQNQVIEVEAEVIEKSTSPFREPVISIISIVETIE